MSEIQHIDWNRIAKNAGGFSPLVFEFIRDGLEHTIRTVHGPGDVGDETRHVSGAQLCLGFRDLAVRRYGALARTVLKHWGVQATEDFGRLVFALIEAGVLRESQDDRYDDFVGVYDFDEAFAEAELI
ncbi:MAG: Minf_1886 family protein [Planctomycetota bacterium]